MARILLPVLALLVLPVVLPLGSYYGTCTTTTTNTTTATIDSTCMGYDRRALNEWLSRTVLVRSALVLHVLD